MSFSSDVKGELLDIIPNARHCQLSELKALLDYGQDRLGEDSPGGRKFFTLQKKTSIINEYVEVTIKSACCKRAYLRGAFLTVGSVADPNKEYDLEFVADDQVGAVRLKEYLSDFGIESKVTARKSSYVTYIKEAEGVVDTLNVLGAHKSLMYLENLRAEKDFRNLINRQVNCETANLQKMAAASTKQIEGILKIERLMGLEKLSIPLQDVAKVRLEHQDASLSELGGYLDPPVGKSGVNHRLRKLCEIADSLSE